MVWLLVSAVATTHAIVTINKTKRKIHQWKWYRFDTSKRTGSCRATKSNKPKLFLTQFDCDVRLCVSASHKRRRVHKLPSCYCCIKLSQSLALSLCLFRRPAHSHAHTQPIERASVSTRRLVYERWIKDIRTVDVPTTVHTDSHTYEGAWCIRTEINESNRRTEYRPFGCAFVSLSGGSVTVCVRIRVRVFDSQHSDRMLCALAILSIQYQARAPGSHLILLLRFRRVNIYTEI